MRSVKSVGDDAYIVPRADVGIRPLQAYRRITLV